MDHYFELIQSELKRLAAHALRNESATQTLQPTALVNEAYVRLAKSERLVINDRNHFLALASQVMRRVLVDHARRRRTEKRSARHVTLDSYALGLEDSEIDMLALDRALELLTEADPVRARLVEMHFFAGMSAKDAGDIVGLKERTAYLHLRSAKAFLTDAIQAK